MAAAYVQGAGAGADSVTGLPVTFPANPAAHSCLVAFVTAGSTATVSGIASAGGTSWAQSKSEANSAIDAEIWTAPDCVGGASDKTVTITLSAAVASAATIFELSGLVLASPLDQSAVAASLATGSITPSAGGEIVLAMAADGTNVTAPGSGWTCPVGSVHDGFSFIFMSAVYQIQTAAAAASATFTGGSSSPAGIILSLKSLVAARLPSGLIVPQAVQRSAAR